MTSKNRRKYNLHPKIQSTLERAWKVYSHVSETFTLEGSSDIWAGCAIFAACSMTVNSSMNGKEINGNCISLMSLLDEIGITLIDFMTKIKRWSEMAQLGETFDAKIMQLEKNFSVVTVIFKKFAPIFRKGSKSLESFLTYFCQIWSNNFLFYDFVSFILELSYYLYQNRRYLKTHYLSLFSRFFNPSRKIIKLVVYIYIA